VETALVAATAYVAQTGEPLPTRGAAASALLPEAEALFLTHFVGSCPLLVKRMEHSRLPLRSGDDGSPARPPRVANPAAGPVSAPPSPCPVRAHGSMGWDVRKRVHTPSSEANTPLESRRGFPRIAFGMCARRFGLSRSFSLRLTAL